MKSHEPIYVQILKKELSDRQRRNSMYSLRAFAKDVGIAAPVISEVFKGKRGLPKKNASQVADKLELIGRKRKSFLDSVLGWKRTLKQLAEIEDKKQFTLLDEETHAKVIGEWEHYALLSLMETQSFRSDVKWIANRMGLSPIRVEVVLKNLLDTGLIALDKQNKFQKTSGQLASPENVVSMAARQGHRESLQIAIEKHSKVDIEDRYYSSTTVAIDRKKIKEAKALSQEFRRKLAALLEDGDKTDVYQIAIQIFPMIPLNELK